MTRLLLFLSALAWVCPAQGADQVFAYEAETTQATTRGTVTAGGVGWTCAATRCTASGRGGSVSVKGCTELARQVGPITSYRSELKRLGDTELRECNRIATGTPAPAKDTPAAAQSAPGVGKPQRATTGELAYTGMWPPGSATAERRP